ncbi:MAG: type II toxin-antitoxin system VapC family toxin [Caulobacterales bacterium]|nr:type II toxin-antitoxin system VapC family toxin [Caulobacterales bacterium]
MRLLVDTHIFLWVVQDRDRLRPWLVACLEDPANDVWLSVINLWEVRVKHEAGRLELLGTVAQAADRFLQDADRLLHVTRDHVLTATHDAPATRDPFDRLLFSQCEAEDMRLLTVDDKLAGHRLAWRPQ